MIVGKISTKNIFGFDTDVLVELFSPKENKSNSSFEIIIEDSLFISQPVFINWHNSKYFLTRIIKNNFFLVIMKKIKKNLKKMI